MKTHCGRLSWRRGVAVALAGALNGMVLAALPAKAVTQVSVGLISGQFFANPEGNCSFSATPASTVAFGQDFPVIDFNPPVGTVSCNPATGVDQNTRPLTDVVPQTDGSCTTIPAAGNGLQAGVAPLTSFFAVFTAALTVPAAGDVTFNFFSDDGWILSFGQGPGGAQPNYVSGPNIDPPATGAFTGFQVVGSFNTESAPTQNNLVVNFPAAGEYPFELDYTECAGGQLALTLTASGQPIPPAPTDTPTGTPTDTPTQTPTETPPPTSAPTDTPTTSPTVMPSQTPADTPTPTNTVTFTDTATNTPTRTPTGMPTETATDTPTSTPVPTDSRTETPTQPFTATATPADTPLPTTTPTDTPTTSPTVMPSQTPTDTPAPTNTVTLTSTPIATTTPTPVATATATPIGTGAQNQPPDCTAAVASPEVLSPPNHELVEVAVAGVTDPDGDSVTIIVTAITQNEPLDGRGDGTTCPDGGGVGTSTAIVRAERARQLDGRVYHVSFSASDGKGGLCVGMVTVCVPRDQRAGSSCVDDGPLIDSTGPCA